MSPPSGFVFIADGSQQLVGGNPDAWRRVGLFLQAPGFIYATHDFKIEYGPAVAGAITNLDFAYDLRYDSADGNRLDWAPGNVQDRQGLSQGIYPRDRWVGVSSGNWGSHEALGLTCSDFDAVDNQGSLDGVRG